MKQQFVFLVASISLMAISACWASSVAFSVANNSTERNCKCYNDDCGCCEYINWSYIGINGTVCTNFSYLPDDYGISITVTYNAYTLFNETVSARNPPPFCFGIPDLEKISAHICLRLYDLTFAEKHFHGCMKLSISVYHVIHKSMNLGCFDLPKKALEDAYTIASHRILKILKIVENELKIINTEMKYLEFWKKDAPEVNII